MQERRQHSTARRHIVLPQPVGASYDNKIFTGQFRWTVAAADEDRANPVAGQLFGGSCRFIAEAALPQGQRF